MPTIALTSSKQGPGATIAALALASAWAESHSTLLAELDCDGGDLISTCDLTTEGSGLMSLAVEGRHGSMTLDASTHTQRFGVTNLPVLAASPSPTQTKHAISMLGRRLLPALRSAADVVVVDSGRFHPDSPVNAMLSESDLTLVALRPTLTQVHAVSNRLDALKQLGPELGLVIIGDKPHSVDEIQTVLDLPVVGVLADDPRGVELLTEGGRSRFAKSSLLARSARSIANHISSKRFQPAEALS